MAELDPPRRWRERTLWWADLIGAERTAAVRAAVRLAAGKGVDPGRLPLLTGYPAGPELADGEIRAIGGRLFASGVQEELWQEILDFLGGAHRDTPRSRGIPLESVRGALAVRFAPVLVDYELESLVRAGVLSRAGPEICLSTHEVRLTTAESEALQRVHDLVAGARLAPPAPDRLAERSGVGRPLLNDLLRILVEEGRLVRVSPEIYLSREAEQELRSVARDVIRASAPASPGAFGEALQLSRRELIPLLEYLDREGVTRRTDAGRIAGDVGPGG